MQIILKLLIKLLLLYHLPTDDRVTLMLIKANPDVFSSTTSPLQAHGKRNLNCESLKHIVSYCLKIFLLSEIRKLGCRGLGLQKRIN